MILCVQSCIQHQKTHCKVTLLIPNYNQKQTPAAFGEHHWLVHFTFYTLHSTLYTPHSILYTVHFALYILHSALYTLHPTLHPHFTLYVSHSTLYTLHVTHHTLNFTLHTLHFKYIILCTSLRSTLCALHSTVYPHFTLYA